MQFFEEKTESLKSSTASSTTASRAVSRNGRNILNASDLHSIARQRTQRCLSTRARRFGLSASAGSHLDVQRVHAELLESLGNVGGGLHSFAQE